MVLDGLELGSVGKNEHTRKSWQILFKKRIAMINCDDSQASYETFADTFKGILGNPWCSPFHFTLFMNRT